MKNLVRSQSQMKEQAISYPFIPKSGEYDVQKYFLLFFKQKTQHFLTSFFALLLSLTEKLVEKMDFLFHQSFQNGKISKCAKFEPSAIFGYMRSRKCHDPFFFKTSIFKRLKFSTFFKFYFFMLIVRHQRIFVIFWVIVGEKLCP